MPFTVSNNEQPSGSWVPGYEVLRRGNEAQACSAPEQTKLDHHAGQSVQSTQCGYDSQKLSRLPPLRQTCLAISHQRRRCPSVNCSTDSNKKKNSQQSQDTHT